MGSFFLEENQVDPEVAKKIDIGFPFLKPSRTEEVIKRMEHIKAHKKNVTLEKLARSNECKLYMKTEIF